jgi:anthranilate phosphoribosyltransferase
VALVAAGGGLKVAKHGNRALSSKSGGADVLSELGVAVDPGSEKQLRRWTRPASVSCSAQAHNAAMRHVSPIRAELGFRTIFNLLAR